MPVYTEVMNFTGYKGVLVMLNALVIVILNVRIQWTEINKDQK